MLISLKVSCKPRLARRRKQLHTNPKAELCAFKGGEWIRVAGELVEDNRVEAWQSMLDAYPSLKKSEKVLKRCMQLVAGNTEFFTSKWGGNH